MDLIQRTIDLANANVERGGRPFACIVAKGGEIIAIDAYWNHLPGCVEAPAAS